MEKQKETVGGYKDYMEVIEGLQPKVFRVENSIARIVKLANPCTALVLDPYLTQ